MNLSTNDRIWIFAWTIPLELQRNSRKSHGTTSTRHWLTLKWTWMWSRRTSTRKNFRAQISQVYFLSPWVNRCLFMLLLQENTCAHKHTGDILLNYLLLLISTTVQRVTFPQMGQGDGSFLYLVPSSPLASSSSLFMCFWPALKRFSFSQQRLGTTWNVLYLKNLI